MSSNKLPQLSNGFNGVGPASEAAASPIGKDKNALIILGANRHRGNRKTGSAPAATVAATNGKASDPVEAELQLLKSKLRSQEQRLSQPLQLTPHRPPGNGSGSAARGGQTGSPIRGSLYNQRPYQGVAPKIMWEPFNGDKEVSELNERIACSEERMNTKTQEMQNGWKFGRRQQHATIPPPDPPVFAAKEDEVMPLVAKAENFAEAQHIRFAMIKQEEDNTAVDSAGDSSAPSPTNENNTSTKSSDKNALNESSVSKRDVSRRMSSFQRKRGSILRNDTTLAILNKMEGLPSINLTMPSPDEIDIERQGDVLGSRYLLKRDLFEAAFTRRDQVGVMSGAPYFRLVPKFNVGGCAQGHVSGIRTILNEIVKVYKGTIVWVNLREEPVVYINGRSHIIRSVDDPTHPVIIPGITARRVGQMESKLKNEILYEANLHCGNICVHKESANGSIDLLWEAVDEHSVQTVEETYGEFEDKGINVRYLRQPIAQGVGPNPQDFQFVVQKCLEYPESPIIFNCQTGRGRSSVMMMITTIVRFYQHCTKDVDIDVNLLKGDGKAVSFRTLLKLLAMLPDGSLHERRVAILSELSDKIYNVGDKIHRVFSSGQEPSPAALMRLSQYAHLIVFSCYCEQKFWTNTFDGTFAQWMDAYPEIKVLLQSIGQTSGMHAAIPERLVTPIGEDSDVSLAVRARRGQVLSSNMVLRSFSKDVIGVSASTVPGVVGLRQVSSACAIYTCGRTTDQGFEDLVYAIRQQFGDSVQNVHWVNLRAEPMVFINNVAYLLLDYQSVNGGDELATMHISAERLEEIEAKLKNDVLTESEQNNGTMILHECDNEGEVVAKRIRVGSVKTPRVHFEQIAEYNNAKYHRVPFPQKSSLRTEDFDPLLNVLNDITEDDAIILNDSDGALRTTVAANIACAQRFSYQEQLRQVTNVEDVNQVLNVQGGTGLVLSSSPFYGGMEEAEQFSGNKDGLNIELMVASALCQMLAAGTFIPATRSLIEFCGRGSKWNILEAIDTEKRHYDQSGGDNKKKSLVNLINHIRTYLHVLLCCIYLDEDTTEEKSFTAWCDSLQEVRNILDNLEDRPAKTIKYVLATNLMASHTMERAVDRRNGNVLTANFGMKADHFPGCQKKGLVPAISGAPNFRKVTMVNVYGVAIPTKTGVYNLLSVLGANDAPVTLYPGDEMDPLTYTGYPQPRIVSAQERVYDNPIKGHVLWFNLREEPIIYVGDRPFVFRDLTNPYVNVELTGIETSKIESVEQKLKKDIMDEADKYDGKFLVHDEGNPGELVGMWETANNQTVKTVRELYEEASSEEGCRVTFVRLPVTDEQSPEYKDFDQLIEKLLPYLLKIREVGEEDPISFVFNCQMGRGRTTTGMVVCCLLVGLIRPEFFTDLEEKYPKLWEDSDTPFAKGNYKCILQLRSVLSDGRDAKRRLDLILEACNKMQNLRSAIEGFKQQVESPDLPEESRGRAHHHGINYLRRYFNLIAFSSYLYEEFDRDEGFFATSFADWMDARGELNHLHDTAALL